MLDWMLFLIIKFTEYTARIVFIWSYTTYVLLNWILLPKMYANNVNINFTRFNYINIFYKVDAQKVGRGFAVGKCHFVSLKC